MTQYNVDAAELATASSRALQSAGTIRSEVASMIAQLTALEGSWQGSASVAFTGLLAQWRSAQAQVEGALDGLTTALGQASEQYQTAEDNAARLFSR